MKRNILIFIRRLETEPAQPRSAPGHSETCHAIPLLLSPHFRLWALTPMPPAPSAESMLFSPRLYRCFFSDSQPGVFPTPSLIWGCVENPAALHVWPYWLSKVFLFLPLKAVNEQIHLRTNPKDMQVPTYSTRQAVCL